MFQIHPVAHLVGKIGPLIGVHHHILAASIVIVIHTDFLTDILLGNTQALLNAQFHRQTVGIPSGLTLDLIALHRLVAQEGILNGTAHHMVDTRMTVSRWRSLEEYEGWTAFTFGNASVEKVLPFPLLQNLLVHITEVQFTVFCKFLAHIVFYFILIYLGCKGTQFSFFSQIYLRNKKGGHP